MAQSGRNELQIGKTVRLKTGAIGKIVDVNRPLGYREFSVESEGQLLRLSSLQMDVLEEWEMDESDVKDEELAILAEEVEKVGGIHMDIISN